MSNNEGKKGRKSYRDRQEGGARVKFLEKKICWLLDENLMMKKELGRIKSAMDQVICILTKQGHIINLKRGKKNSIPFFSDNLIDSLEQNIHKEQFEQQIEEFDKNEDIIEITIEDEDIENKEGDRIG